jgi:peroxiredoxin
MGNDVHLILADGALLECVHVKLEGNHKLYIYSDSEEGTGRLYQKNYQTRSSSTSPGMPSLSDKYIDGEYNDAAGIGSGGGEGNNMGSLYVHGGIVEATNGGMGAAIGGGKDGSIGGEVVIYGGKVTAQSINTNYNGAETRTFSTSQLTGETVIVFFNTWCSDCQRDLPLLNDYYLQHKDDDGFQMVAISRAEGVASVSDFWKANNLQIPYSAQDDRRIYDLFASSIIPRIYFVSPQGIITRIDIEHFDSGK